MNGQAVSQADDPQEQWNRVHAQLLKSVADAQAKLLAAQNETNDEVLRSGDALNGLRMRMDHIDKALADLRVLIGQTQEAVRNSHVTLSGRLDGLKDICVVNGSMLHQIGTELPRRQVERLKPKRIVKRAVERKRRQ